MTHVYKQKYFEIVLTEGQKPPVTLRQVDIPNNCSSDELLQAIRSELSLADNNIVLKVSPNFCPNFVFSSVICYGLLGRYCIKDIFTIVIMKHRLEAWKLTIILLQWNPVPTHAVNVILALVASSLLDNIRVMVIVWRLRGNIIRTAVCWIVWHNVCS